MFCFLVIKVRYAVAIHNLNGELLKLPSVKFNASKSLLENAFS